MIKKLVHNLKQLLCTQLTSNCLDLWYGLFILSQNKETLTYILGLMADGRHLLDRSTQITSRHTCDINFTFMSSIKSVVFIGINKYMCFIHAQGSLLKVILTFWFLINCLLPGSNGWECKGIAYLQLTRLQVRIPAQAK